jgi:CRP-like cAMP-binding protein
MPIKISGLRAETAVRPMSPNNGHPNNNTILSALPRAEREALAPLLTFVEIPNGTLLNEMGEPIKFAYFVTEGLASILSVMNDGKSVEVGLAGKEGFVGLPLVVGFTTSSNRVVMQVGGSGFRIGAADLRTALRNSPSLERALNRFSQELGLQATYVAACNRLHEVSARLARWLLMSQDRIGGNLVPLTQEFLAHMLGTRRASVTVAASMLQKAGVITYKRGAVTVKNRRGLEAASCECYKLLTRQASAWGTENESRTLGDRQESSR